MPRIENNNHRATLRTRIMIWFLRHWPSRPVAAGTDLRWADVVLIAAVVIVIVLMLMVAENKGFVQRYNEVRASQESMQVEINQLQEDVTKVSDAIETWPGITKGGK